MNLRILFICIIVGVAFFFPYQSQAQNGKDSVVFYKRLFEKANKHAWSRWLYNITIKSSVVKGKDSVFIAVVKNKKNPFQSSKGKYIRSINIVVLDPFGYSVDEFVGTKPSYMERVGNKLHSTSKEKMINNMLLFKEGSIADPLKMSESERLLRLSPYVYDARLYVYKLKKSSKDSIDVLVLVQDKWTTFVWSSFNITVPNLTIKESNFLGLGHQIEENVSWQTGRGYIETRGKYSIYNIKRSYIQSDLFYADLTDRQEFGAALNRPFYSQLARWAGGITTIRNNTIIAPLNIEGSIVTPYAINYNTFDVWGAVGFAVKKPLIPVADLRIIRLLTGARYYNKTYIKRPSFDIDTGLYNQNENLYLINFGITKQSYYRDRYLFRFGANEDIPEGAYFEILPGYLTKELSVPLFYTGFNIGIGNHIEKFGYLSTNLGFGTFYENGNARNGVLNLSALYFTDLLRINRWHFRQFVRFKFVNGFRQTNNAMLLFNSDEMYGLSSDLIKSKSKVVLNYEFLIYAPYKLLGFQFAPVLFIGLAGLANDYNLLLKGQIYHAYAIGILIRNEYLIAGTFQVSIGIYPYMPGSSDFLIKTNPISNYNVRARDFRISKPELVPYN